MIEFKGECGHTIRAKNEDAGKVVRCSYCGREAPVPDQREDQLDFLLNEVERTGDYDPVKKRRMAKSRPPGQKSAPIRPRSDFNPFAVALKMCYAAIIITVLIVAGKFAYKSWVAMDRPEQVAQDDQNQPTNGQGSPANPGGSTNAGRGLLHPQLAPSASGIFVNSVPRKTTVYVRNYKESYDVSILRDRDVRANKVPAWSPINLPPGRYEVAVVLPLTDPELMKLPGYRAARPEFESPALKRTGSTSAGPEAVEKARTAALREYFLPDREKNITIETLTDHSKVIVRYYDMEVVRDAWTPETALFLPRGLDCSQLIRHLPSEKVFGFDEAAVRQELDYCGVPETDHLFLLDALSRVGMVPYEFSPEKQPGTNKKDKERYRLFHVSLMNGTVSTTPLS